MECQCGERPLLGNATVCTACVIKMFEAAKRNRIEQHIAEGKIRPGVSAPLIKHRV